MNSNRFRVCAVLAILCVCAQAKAAVVSFEDVTMPNEQSYAGGRYWSGLVPPTDGSIESSFVSAGASFHNTNNECCGGATFWSGFAYSNTTDTTTAGFGNQYSAYAGGGAGGSANYALAHAGEFAPTPRIEFGGPTLLGGAMLGNTTYAALSMLHGDSFAKQFGGASGDDPDFLLLTITGRDGANAVTGTVDFYLADYRDGENANDYIVDSWAFVALDSLGLVSALEFAMSSSDVGAFGSNTPLYFAIDDIQVVPLPAAAWLLLPALGVVAAKTGRRRKLRVAAS